MSEIIESYRVTHEEFIEILQGMVKGTGECVELIKNAIKRNQEDIEKDPTIISWELVDGKILNKYAEGFYHNKCMLLDYLRSVEIGLKLISCIGITRSNTVVPYYIEEENQDRFNKWIKKIRQQGNSKIGVI